MSILQELETTAVQYDEHVKRILCNRYVLAWILKCTTLEFSELSIKRIAQECFSEDISISKVRVMPGRTNTDVERKGERILGANTEDKVPGEGEIYYDIRFSAYAPNNEEVVKILLNVEAQMRFKLKYALVTRGIFYAARMISAQMDTEFTAGDYSNMKKVYSVWVCMNAPNYIGNAISEYSIKKSDIIEGIPDKREEYDKISIVLICLNGTKKGREKGEGIVGLLNTLLTSDMEIEEKAKILTENYGIEVDNSLEEEMEHMCNLGEGLMLEAYEDGLEKGREEGRNLKRNIIKNMLKKGMPETDIMALTECTIELISEVQELMRKE